MSRPASSKTSFLRNDQGAVAITFGLTAIISFVVIGGAVDMSRWLLARAQTKSAMDAAVLAGARKLQLDNTDKQGALATAARYYAENVASRIHVAQDEITFELSNNDAAVSAAGTAFIDTMFLGIAGIDRLALIDASATDRSQATTATGGNSDVSIELSLMLDTTGSMRGQKIDDLKDAAKDLIDIVVWDDQSKATAKVAIVPFSQAVNAGPYFNAVTGANNRLAAADIPYAPGQPAKAAPARTFAALQELAGFSAANAKDKSKDDDNSTSDSAAYTNYSTCVVERVAHRDKDTVPGPGKYLGIYDLERASAIVDTGRGYANLWGSPCRPTQTVMPLTSDRDALKDKIDSFVADGYTAGHLGTAWAWYMLSPEWNDIWPANSQTANYGSENVRKIAVLMTDGEYNTHYENANGDASEQAVELCRGMKAKGITVYTVGFALGDNAKAINTLATCATDAGHAYVAENGDQLKRAFRDIALKLSTLRLSR